MNKPSSEVYWAMNRQSKSVALISVSCFELLQGMFRCGITLPNGEAANAIGRSESAAEFSKQAKKSNAVVLSYIETEPKFEIIARVNGTNWIQVSREIFQSWTGKRRIDGIEYSGESINFLSLA